MRTTTNLIRVTLVAFIIFVSENLLFSQTNTFPSSGNVGIGTNNPQHKLDVLGNLRAFQIIGPSTGNLVLSGLDIGTGAGYGIDLNAVENGINFQTYYNGWASRLYVHDNGNIGIGTTNPQHKLDVLGNLRAFQIIGPSTGNLILSGMDNGTGAGYGIDLNAVENGINFQTYNNGWASRLYVHDNGNVGIGTLNPVAKLSVNGNLRATEIRVMTDVSIPDYVFESTYSLRPLSHVESFIKANKHLPEIPSAAEIKENGLDVAEMDALLLKKIEELTLYAIEMNKRMDEMQKTMEKVRGENESLKKQIQSN